MKDDGDLLDLLIQKLRWLRLPGMAKQVTPLLELAAKDNLSTLDVVHRLCDEEKQSRLRSAVDRRLREARFPEINTIDASYPGRISPMRRSVRNSLAALSVAARSATVGGIPASTHSCISR